MPSRVWCQVFKSFLRNQHVWQLILHSEAKIIVCHTIILEWFLGNSIQPCNAIGDDGVVFNVAHCHQVANCH